MDHLEFEEEPVQLLLQELNEPVNESAEEHVDEPMDEHMDESVDEPVDEPVDELVDEPVDELVDELVDESVDQLVDEPVDELVDESAEEPVDESVEEPADEPVDQLVDEPVDEPADEPMDQLVDEPAEELVDELVDESAEELVDELVDESADEPVDESVEEPMDQPMEELVDEPVDELMDESADEPAEEPVDESADELVDQPMDDFSKIIPSIIFIVPYRNREEQLQNFANHMKIILEDYPPNSYRIIYIHQNDVRSFNRGAMKNIGFLYVKETYPNDYKNITLVFNDVDTMPRTKGLMDYQTSLGIVKHFYGYQFSLGGIVSIKAVDFELLNGFPNYWAWGYEDNMFQRRVLLKNMRINRSQFYPIINENIIHLKDGVERMVNRQEFDKYMNEIVNKQNIDGIYTMRDIRYEYDKSNQFVHVHSFTPIYPENPALNRYYDIRNGLVPFRMNNQQRARMRLINMGGIR